MNSQRSSELILEHAENIYTCPPGDKLSTIAPTKGFCRPLLL